MMKIFKFLIATVLIGLAVQSCNKKDDDGIITVPPRDKGEQVQKNKSLYKQINNYHNYNYEWMYLYRVTFLGSVGDLLLVDIFPEFLFAESSF